MSTTDKSPKAPASKPAVEKKASAPRPPKTHPKYEDMVTQAIKKVGDERTGASRPHIKKYLIKTFKLEENAHFVHQVNAAIQRGYERGIFDLPKGLSGKVKLDNGKENDTPSPARGPAKKTVLGSKRAGTSSRSAPTARKAPSERKPPVKSTSRVAAMTKNLAAAEAKAKKAAPKPKAAPRKKAAPAKKAAAPAVKKAAAKAPVKKEAEKKSAPRKAPTARKPAATGKAPAKKAAAAKKVEVKKPASKKTVAAKSVASKAKADKPKSSASTKKAKA